MKLSLKLLPFLGLLAASPAWAGMSCDDIMKMVGYNVPSSTVIASIRSAGGGYTMADVQCLQQRGAPPDIVSAVQGLAGGGAPPPPPVQPTFPAPMPAYPPPAPQYPAPVPSYPPPQPAYPTPQPAPPYPAPVPRPTPIPPPPVQPLVDSGTPSAGPTDAGPAVVQQLIADEKAKKCLTASKGFYDLLAKNAYPDATAEIEYHLARCLEELGMYHGAYHYYLEVIKAGTGGAYFRFALPGLVRIANISGDDSDLLAAISKIPPEAFPREAQNTLDYLMGRKMYQDSELTKAKEHFEKVSQKSELYMRAQFFLGQINVEQGKLKSAVLSFREVMKAEPPVVGNARDQAQIEDMKDLALLNVARVYFGLERYDNADNYYEMVNRGSIYWPESLFERAWANFHQGDLNGVLGLLLTVNSPFYSDQEFIPEVTILRALSFFNLCQWKDVEKTLTDFDATYKPMQTELKGFLDQYKTEESIRLSDQAWDYYFGPKPPQTALDKALFVKVLRNRDIQGLVNHMDEIDTELQLITVQKAEWQATIGQGLQQIYADDRAKIKKRAGRAMLQELLEQYRKITDLLQQSQVIRFEVVDAQRADYEYRMQNPDVSSTKDAVQDFATSYKIIYWPFNGEFWSDELGYYRYSEEGQCK